MLQRISFALLILALALSEAGATPVAFEGSASDTAHINLFYYAPGTSFVSQDIAQTTADSLAVLYDESTRRFNLSATFSAVQTGSGSFIDSEPPAWWTEPLTLIYSTTLYPAPGPGPYDVGAELVNLPLHRGDAATFLTIPSELRFSFGTDGSLQSFYLASSAPAETAAGSAGAYLEFILASAVSPSASLVLPDYDLDGTSDFADQCPFNAAKTAPGACGCEVSDLDTDQDAAPDCLDIDDDNDNIADAQELLDGSDPLDPGSGLENLQQTVCAGWNSFLDAPLARIWNVLETMNVAANGRTISARLYAGEGAAGAAQRFTLEPLKQFDLLLHQLPGWFSGGYGDVCSTVEDGAPGDLDGRIAVYRTDERLGPNRFQFAYAVPVSSGLSGEQAVQFNLNQPSLDPAELKNVVANWLQLTNAQATTENGRLLIYGETGKLERALRVLINANNRIDIPLHELSASRVGFALWQPDSRLSRFEMRNIRYVYDNALGSESFTGVTALEGRAGSGRALAAPLDTRGSSAILELSNITAEPLTVVVQIYNASGLGQLAVTRVLAPFASEHLIADGVLMQSSGLAVVQGSRAGALIAHVLEYGRTPAGGLNYLYAVRAVEPLGAALHGSYNSFLEQSCSLVVSNPTDAPQPFTVELFAPDAAAPVFHSRATAPAKGLAEIPICQNAAPNSYGLVNVQPDTPNKISALVIRHGKLDDFRFATGLRQ